MSKFVAAVGPSDWLESRQVWTCQSSEIDQSSVYYSLEGQQGKLKLKFPLHIEVAVRAVWTLELSPTRLYY